MANPTMSQSAEAPKGQSVELTAREYEIATAVLRSMMSDDIKIDYANMANLLGLKSNGSAATRWSELKKKLFAGGLGAGPSTPSKPRATKKPKASDSNGVKKKVTKKQASAAKASSTATTTTPEASPEASPTTTTAIQADGGESQDSEEA